MTFKLSYGKNHHYGSPYVAIDYEDFHKGHNEGISAYLSMKIDESVDFSILLSDKTSLHDLHKYFYDGMKSNNIKSKYFNLFLILEYLEYSDRYKQLFSNTPLFNKEEKDRITDLAESFTNEIKKGAIKNILSRTELPRKEKLYSLLNDVGVNNYSILGTERADLLEENIATLITTRNKLFHKGMEFDENIVWNILIPLTRKVVKIVSKNPDILNNR